MKESNAEDSRRTGLIKETVTAVYEYAQPQSVNIQHTSGFAQVVKEDALPAIAAPASDGAQQLLIDTIGKEREFLRKEAQRLELERAALVADQTKFAANKKRSIAMRGNNFAKGRKKKAKKTRR